METQRGKYREYKQSRAITRVSDFKGLGESKYEG